MLEWTKERCLCRWNDWIGNAGWFVGTKHRDKSQEKSVYVVITLPMLDSYILLWKVMAQVDTVVSVRYTLVCRRFRRLQLNTERPLQGLVANAINGMCIGEKYITVEMCH